MACPAAFDLSSHQAFFKNELYSWKNNVRLDVAIGELTVILQTRDSHVQIIEHSNCLLCFSNFIYTRISLENGVFA